GETGRSGDAEQIRQAVRLVEFDLERTGRTLVERAGDLECKRPGAAARQQAVVRERSGGAQIDRWAGQNAASSSVVQAVPAAGREHDGALGDAGIFEGGVAREARDRQ